MSDSKLASVDTAQLDQVAGGTRPPAGCFPAGPPAWGPAPQPWYPQFGPQFRGGYWNPYMRASYGYSWRSWRGWRG